MKIWVYALLILLSFLAMCICTLTVILTGHQEYTPVFPITWGLGFGLSAGLIAGAASGRHLE